MSSVKVRTYKRRRRAPSGVTVKKVVTPSGDVVSIRSISANSPSFGGDFLRVFSENVKKARRENLERFGSADRAPAEH